VDVSVNVAEAGPDTCPPGQVEHDVGPGEDPLQVEFDQVADLEGETRGPHQAGSPHDFFDRVVTVGEPVHPGDHPALLHEPGGEP
jgi:hypothetical protein